MEQLLSIQHNNCSMFLTQPAIRIRFLAKNNFSSSVVKWSVKGKTMSSDMSIKLQILLLKMYIHAI